MSPPVRTIDERGGAWVRVVLDGPRGNLLSLEMVRALVEVLADAARGSVARKWITLEGAGGEFSFGAMIHEHVPAEMDRVLPETHALIRQVLALPVATSALVRGRCLGGGFELALACDTIIAAEDAVLGLPEIGLGAFPPAAAALLPLKIGANRATAAIITGESLPAKWWCDAGVVAAVVAGDVLIQEAGQWFDTHLAPRSAVALGAAVQAARLTLRAQAAPAIEAAERLYLDRLLRTHDAVEGVRAFLEKRQPKWIDR